MIVEPRWQAHLEAALRELAEPEISFTGSFLATHPLECVQGVPIVHRVKADDDGVQFFFGVQGRRSYFRVLTLTSEPEVYSVKVIPGHWGTVTIESDLGYRRSPAEWKSLLVPGTVIQESKDGHLLSIPLSTHGAWQVTELVEAFVPLLREDAQRTFVDWALDNRVELRIQSFLPPRADPELAFDRWNVRDLSDWNLSLRVTVEFESDSPSATSV